MSNRQTTVSVTLMVIFLHAIGSISLAEDWPEWRGANRDGDWNETGLLEKFSSDRLEKSRSVPIGAGYSGPTVAVGRVYVTDRVTEPKQIERIHCFDATNGETIWSHAYDCEYENVGYKAGPRASVTIVDGRAYALGAMGNLHCLDAATGEVHWHNDLNTKLSLIHI